MKSEKRFWAIVALVFVAILVWQIFAGIMPALQRGVAALTPFLIAFATAYLLRHPVIWLERLLVFISKRKTHKWQHAAACAMVLILFLGLAGLLVAVIVPNVINNITDLVIRLPEYINTFTAFLSQQIEALSQWLDIDVNGYVVSVLQSAAEKAKDSAEAFAGAFQLFSAATGIVSSTISFLFDAVIYIIATFCLLYDYNKIKRSVKRLLRVFVRDNAHYNNVCAVCHESDVIIEKYIVVRLSTSLGLGIVSYIGFLILGLPYAILLATVIAITNLVPYIGPIVGAVPPILIALTAGDTRLAIGTAVFIIICQQIEGNILTPLLTGDALQVSPLLLLVGIAVFGAMMGIPGMILGAPIVAILAGIARKAMNAAEQAAKHNEQHKNAEEQNDAVK